MLFRSFALYALQHRGQESAGIAVSDGRRIQAVRELGLVSQVFDETTLATLEGVAAVGHARYSTTGSSRWQNAQPVIRHRTGRTVALAHNGNLVNTTALREELETAGLSFDSTSDTEVIAALICEHDGDLVDGVIKLMLSRYGVEVIEACDGQVGVNLALRHDFEVILMDMQMPEMDGYTATRELRNTGFRGPIIAVTAHALSSDRAKCSECGCDEYLTKPYSLEMLSKIIEKVKNKTA